jgi:hypothetical protein
MEYTAKEKEILGKIGQMIADQRNSKQHDFTPGSAAERAYNRAVVDIRTTVDNISKRQASAAVLKRPTNPIGYPANKIIGKVAFVTPGSLAEKAAKITVANKR